VVEVSVGWAVTRRAHGTAAAGLAVSAALIADGAVVLGRISHNALDTLSVTATVDALVGAGQTDGVGRVGGVPVVDPAGHATLRTLGLSQGAASARFESVWRVDQDVARCTGRTDTSGQPQAVGWDLVAGGVRATGVPLEWFLRRAARLTLFLCTDFVTRVHCA